MVRQAVPLQPIDDDGGADIHLQPVEDPTLEQVDAPEGGCDPVGSLCWSKLLAGPVKTGAHARAAEEGIDRVAWWSPGIQLGSTHHKCLHLIQSKSTLF
ncbi:AN1-type zinc finger protein 5-like [Grus japonensis]|uniref:AN1-type zinc finger protein 5-like n=1 Tax=Grus japonensis TaxID=30415 RepID=A0ABC9W0B0_GRUJA